MDVYRVGGLAWSCMEWGDLHGFDIYIKLGIYTFFVIILHDIIVLACTAHPSAQSGP